MMCILFNGVLVGTMSAQKKTTNPHIIILSQEPILRIDIAMQFWFSYYVYIYIYAS